MPSKFDTQIQALRQRVIAAGPEDGNWLLENDVEILTALIDAAYHADQTKREDAEMMVLSYEVAVEQGVLDDDDAIEVDASVVDDDDEEEADEPPPYKEV